MPKQKLLDEIAKEIEKCKTCKVGKIGKAVPGEGNPNANIVFIGEAPGRNESITGRPFIGRSGQYLTKLIESIGLSRQDVFITSPVKYFPVNTNQGATLTGKGRAPTDAEIAHGRTHLSKQIEVINPKIIVLLGRVAAKAMFGKSPMISEVHGRIVEKDGKKFFFAYHPAAAIRFQEFKVLIEQDFRLLKKLINRQ